MAKMKIFDFMCNVVMLMRVIMSRAMAIIMMTGMMVMKMFTSSQLNNRLCIHVSLLLLLNGDVKSVFFKNVFFESEWGGHRSR